VPVVRMEQRERSVAAVHRSRDAVANRNEAAQRSGARSQAAAQENACWVRRLGCGHRVDSAAESNDLPCAEPVQVVGCDADTDGSGLRATPCRRVRELLCEEKHDNERNNGRRSDGAYLAYSARRSSNSSRR